MKDKWKLVERGISVIIILGVLAGWVRSSTIQKARSEADMEYVKKELAEIKEELKEIAKIKDLVNENTDNITRTTTILEFHTD